MVLFILFVIFAILIQLSLTIRIKIEIKNLKFQFPKFDGKFTNKDSEIYLKIYILNKIRIFKINLKRLNSRNKGITNIVKKKTVSNGFNINTINFLKKSQYIIEKMNLQILIGTEDAGLTAIIFGITSAIVSSLLSQKVTDINLQKYEIKPIYNKNIFNVKFDGIFTLKIANIICIIKYMKKRGVNKNGRTSNRRTYAYSNE